MSPKKHADKFLMKHNIHICAKKKKKWGWGHIFEVKNCQAFKQIVDK